MQRIYTTSTLRSRAARLRQAGARAHSHGGRRRVCHGVSLVRVYFVRRGVARFSSEREYTLQYIVSVRSDTITRSRWSGEASCELHRSPSLSHIPCCRRLRNGARGGGAAAVAAPPAGCHILPKLVAVLVAVRFAGLHMGTVQQRRFTKEAPTLGLGPGRLEPEAGLGAELLLGVGLV